MSGLGKMYLPKGPALETARKVLEMNEPMALNMDISIIMMVHTQKRNKSENLQILEIFQ